MGAGAAEISVYLMNGDLIAAECPDDERVLVHLLQRQGVLRRKVAHVLEKQLENSESVFGELLKYGGNALDQALYHRFENNLATFVGSISKPSFTKMKGVFVDNIQMGHVTDDLIDRACALWDEASALDVDTPIIAGAVPFENDQQLWIAKAVGRGERTVSSVLLDLPMEELQARTVILEMLAKNMVVVAGSEPEPADEPTDAGEDDVELGEKIEEAETVYGIDAAAVKAALAAEMANDPEPEPELEPEPEAEPEPEYEHDQVPQNGPRNSYAPSSFRDWQKQASVVDDDELDFFADHDSDRGSGSEGAFSTESHNLDRVEVMGIDDEPIQADEAPQSFSAPTLSEDEAVEKIEVVNEVLSHVVKAFDEAEGHGRGRAVVQLLVDGSPSKFQTLLRDLQITDDGELPDDSVLDNLLSRPPSEHRQLVNMAFIDLIERALSSAGDELPDEQFDTMYEAVAGYRQRLGL